MLRALSGQKPTTSLVQEVYRKMERKLFDEQNGRITCVTGGAKPRSTS